MCVCVAELTSLPAGPDGPEQLRAEQHHDIRGVAGRVGGADDPAAPGLGRRRRVARRPEGRLGRVRGAVARLARAARHAVLAQLLPAARPARRRVDLRRREICTDAFVRVDRVSVLISFLSRSRGNVASVIPEVQIFYG